MKFNALLSAVLYGTSGAKTNHKYVVLAGEDDLESLLLKEPAVVGEVFHQERKLGSFKILHASAIGQFTVNVFDIWEAQDYRTPWSQVAFEQFWEKIATVNARALERADGDY